MPFALDDNDAVSAPGTPASPPPERGARAGERERPEAPVKEARGDPGQR